ncbi:unnamed protein product [marine sediment metagenome]|uniref:Anaphase-promoting complex subunit 4 WD40 domain-containing protein n=1 Tax=marine sediment metagenome TaxID=412755 RepID=X1TFK0_9ZZZZ
MPEDINSVAISSNGTYIAAGCDNDRIYCFNKSSSTPLWDYYVGSTIREVVVSFDEKYIAAAAEGVYFFNISNIGSPLLGSYPSSNLFLKNLILSQ